jgi:hypothetical protein
MEKGPFTMVKHSNYTNIIKNAINKDFWVVNDPILDSEASSKNILFVTDFVVHTM